MVEIHKKDLPDRLKEGDIIRCTDGAYVFDELTSERIKKRQGLC